MPETRDFPELLKVYKVGCGKKEQKNEGLKNRAYKTILKKRRMYNPDS